MQQTFVAKLVGICVLQWCPGSLQIGPSGIVPGSSGIVPGNRFYGRDLDWCSEVLLCARVVTDIDLRTFLHVFA